MGADVLLHLPFFMSRSRYPVLLLILVTVAGVFGQTTKQIPASELASGAQRAIKLAQTGHCEEALSGLKRASQRIADKALKRETGARGRVDQEGPRPRASDASQNSQAQTSKDGGDEKALAALALLIAVFRFTPSPFCILDEVDAPLDESNVDRFTRLIQQMSGQTQFILITHNKRTMEIAKLLYGVTMEEPGVSKLVSVRFDEVEAEPAALVA